MTKHSKKWILVGLFCSSVFFVLTTSSRADLKGEIKITGSKIKEPTSGLYFVKGTINRVEIGQSGRSMVTLIDTKAKKATILVPAQKISMMMPYDPTQQGPACAGSDYVACLKANGFSKVASETMNGHPCDVYEGSFVVKGNKVHTKFWKPTDLKEHIMVRALNTTENGDTVDVNITNLTETELDASLFKVPPGYQDMSGMLKGMLAPPSH